MKLLMISHDPSMCDPRSSSVARLCEYAEALGEITVVALASRGTPYAQGPSVRIIPACGRSRLARVIAGYRCALARARAWHPDAVTAQDPFFLGLIAYRIARGVRAGFHLQVHGDFFGSPWWSRTPAFRMKLMLGRFLLRRADAIRVVSHRVFASVRRIAPAAPITVAPIAFDPAAYQPLDAASYRSGNEILCVARLEPEKGVEELIRAFARIKFPIPNSQFPILVIVGDGAERSALEGLAKSLGVGDRVRFAGHVPDPRPYYARAAVCVIPSHTESWGRVALEAAASGCPVVMTDTGLAGEVLRNEESALVVPLGDASALAEALGRVLDDATLRDRLVRGASEAIICLDSPEISVQKITASWQKAAGHPLIVITQAVDLDDSNLAFFHDWLLGLAGRVSAIHVLALRQGRSVLPSHVRITVLPQGRTARRVWFLARTLLRELPRSAGVFAHMCPEYAIVAAPLARIFRKKVLLWYTHKSVTFRLRLAAMLVQAIFTASPESCRIRSPKVVVTGHGINLRRFSASVVTGLPLGNPVTTKAPRLLAVGRITPSKDLETPIRALAILRSHGIPATITIVGAPYLPADRAYEAALRAMIVKEGLGDRVIWHGPACHEDLPALYQSHDLLLHTSMTGSIDKVVLEAIACGTPVLSSSEAFRDALPPACLLPPRDAEALAERIAAQRGSNACAPDALARAHDLDALLDRTIIFLTPRNYVRD